MSPFEESSTYQAIIRKGRLSGVRGLVLRLGRMRFGPADEATMAALNAFDDVQKLEELSERVQEVGSWQELLQSGSRYRRGGSRQGST
jgi:hypothetical protein